MLLSQQNKFPDNEVELHRLILELLELLEKKNYKVQRREGPAGGVVLDATQSSRIRDWLGLSLALTIRITDEPGVVRVWVGNQKWVDKLLVGFVGLISILFGFGIFLIISAAIGIYLQYKIAQDTWSVIADHVALRPTAKPY